MSHTQHQFPVPPKVGVFGRTWASFKKQLPEVAANQAAVGLVALIGVAAVWTWGWVAAGGLTKGQSINVTSMRIGPLGVEGEVKDPGYYEKTVGGDQNLFVPIARSEGSQICVLSNIVVTGPAANGASCQLHKASEGWEIQALAAMKCRVTCFKFAR
jgi:hypothetical protein